MVTEQGSTWDFHSIYNTFRCFNRDTYKEEKWTQYFRFEFPTNGWVELLCYANNENQLLFRNNRMTNCIESLTVKQKMGLDLTNIYLQMLTFFSNYLKRRSQRIDKDQKIILIQIHRKYLLLDVMQKNIILSFKFAEGLRIQNVTFLDQTYLIQNALEKIGDYENPDTLLELCKKEKITFYNILNMKVKKSLYLRQHAQFVYEQQRKDNIFQLNCNSLSVFSFGRKGSYALVVLNLTNLKFIRKIVLPNNNYKNKEFLGITQRFALHCFKNQNQIGVRVIDLFNLNVEITELGEYDEQNKCSITFMNQILIVEKFRQKIHIRFNISRLNFGQPNDIFIHLFKLIYQFLLQLKKKTIYFQTITFIYKPPNLSQMNSKIFFKIILLASTSQNLCLYNSICRFFKQWFQDFLYDAINKNIFTIFKRLLFLIQPLIKMLINYKSF